MGLILSIFFLKSIPASCREDMQLAENLLQAAGRILRLRKSPASCRKKMLVEESLL